jgi:CheY-like chemotaxis protein
MAEPRHILLADDDPGLVDLLLAALRDGGYAARTCPGRAVYATAVADPPGLIFLDVRMGDIDGVAVCRQLKADGRTRHIPVVFVTGEEHAAVLERLGDCPHDGFLAKPFDIAALLALACRHLTPLD